jgi:predicted SnoaL-like aldol condensation-catalyzing enzyme
MTNLSTATADRDRAAPLHRPRPVVFGAVVAVALVAVMGLGASVLTNRHVEEPRRIERAEAVRSYDEALQAHDWPALEQLLAPDFILHNLDFGSTQDRHGFVVWARTIGDSYPDFAVSVDEIAFHGDVATVRFHEKALWGVVRARVVEGRIVEMWSNYDEFGLLRQRSQRSRA